MSTLKCRKCGLANFAEAVNCRRCSAQLYSSSSVRKEKRPRRFSVISLAIYATLIYGGYYLYQDAKRSIDEVNHNDAFRVVTQTTQKPQQAGLSRKEHDRQRASSYGNTLKNNPSFEAKRKQGEETKKTMEQASGGGQ